MIVASCLAALHVLGIAMALAGVVWRARALWRDDLPGALSADNLWGVAALLMLSTGLIRLFGFDLPLEWYLANPMFHAKMGVLALVLALEVWPMVSLIALRVRQFRGAAATLAHRTGLAWVSVVQAALVVLMPFLASMMVRGVGM